MKAARLHLLLPAVMLLHGGLLAGPYSAGLNDPANASDAPVPGFVGPDGAGKARLDNGAGGFINARNFVNPLFFGWAVGWTGYVRADAQSSFEDPTPSLGPVTGDAFDIVSLGDLTAAQIIAGQAQGAITLQFTNAMQTRPIRNLPGADLVVFENGFYSEYSTGGAGIGGVFGELAFVEVSSNGTDFARFPGISMTPGVVGGYGSLDPSGIFNLAGKHVNADGESWGTPFDLAALANHPLVTAGTLDLNNVRHVRIVDIPGNGGYSDSAAHPIYDSWRTFGSGGFDLEAVGAISVTLTFEEWQDLHGLEGAQRGELADPEHDGAPNVIEYAFAMLPLTPDADLLPKATLAGGLALSFRRDTRIANVMVEVLGASGLQQPWQAIARSQNGGALVPVAPFAPVIDDASESSIASIGVIRRHRVQAALGQQFLKINVTLGP